MKFDKKGNVTFVCMNCFSIIKVSGIVHEPTYIGLDDFQVSSDAILGTCPCCGYNDENLPEIDPEIARSIVFMNKKHWKTLYCCSSHSEYDAAFYVKFKIPQLLGFGITAPKGFQLEYENHVLKALMVTKEMMEEDSNKVILRVSPKEVYKNVMLYPHSSCYEVYEYLEHDEWEKRHKEHLETFIKWVNDLPDFSFRKFPNDLNKIKTFYKHVKIRSK